MVQFYLRTVKDNYPKLIPEFQAGCLIFISEPTNEEIDLLKEKFLLDGDLLQDALDPHELPRVEVKENLVYIFLRLPIKKNNELITLPILVTISKDFFLIFTKEKIDLLDKFIQNGDDFYTTQRTKLFIQLLSKIIDLYDLYILQINKEIKSFGLDLQKINESHVKQFVYFEIILQDFLNTLLPTKYLFSNILKKGHLELFPRDKDLIEDLILKIEQLEDIAKTSIKNIVHIREAYEIILTNNVNRAIKFLTALTIIVSIPTVIASLFGMNVNLPLEAHPLAFWLILFLSFILMIVIFLIFWRKNWL